MVLSKPVLQPPLLRNRVAFRADMRCVCVWPAPLSIEIGLCNFMTPLFQLKLDTCNFMTPILIKIGPLQLYDPPILIKIGPLQLYDPLF